MRRPSNVAEKMPAGDAVASVRKRRSLSASARSAARCWVMSTICAMRYCVTPSGPATAETLRLTRTVEPSGRT